MIWGDIIWYSSQDVLTQQTGLRHNLNIYKRMLKFIRYYKNIMHSSTQTLSPCLLIFLNQKMR